MSDNTEIETDTDTNSGAEAPTMRQSMEAVYDRLQEGGDAKEQNTGAEAPAGKQPTSQTAAAPDKDGQQGTPPEQAKPLEYWSDGIKAKFGALPPEQQKLMLEISAEANGDYTKKSQELATQKKAFEPLIGATQKWDKYLKSINVTPDVAFEALVGAEYTLRAGTPEQKAAALQKLATDYGIPLPNAAVDPKAAATEQATDPTIAALQKSISELQATQKTQAQQREMEQKQAELNVRQETARQASAEVDTFAATKDETGNPKYPHFNDVRKDMGELIAFTGQQGKVMTMEEAYTKALRMNDTVAAKIEADKKAKADQAAANRAKNARKATSPRSAPPVAANGASPKSLRASLEASYDRVNGA